MKNLPLLIGTMVVTLLLVVGIAFFFSGDGTQTSGVSPVTDTALLVSDTQNVKGATESAQVTVVEFSDLQCPACKAAHPLTSQLTQKYGDKVKIVYRHFPLESIHKNAKYAAQFAQAAALQGKFWEVVDVLFARQQEWSDLGSKEELNTAFLSYLDGLEIDKTALLAKIEDTSVVQRVEQDTVDGNKIGINSTPTFFVNGVPTSAPQLVTAVESIVATAPEKTE